MKKTILVVEDDAGILRGVRDNLRFEGYDVLTCQDGRKGLNMALQESIDLLILDIMLPGRTGFDICRKVREVKCDLPVIILSARGQEADKVAGLDYGADDYMVKPFSVPELLARIRAVLRRSLNLPSADVLRFGRAVIDFAKCEAEFNGQAIHLSAKELDIMKYLCRRPGQVVLRSELLDAVWGYTVYPNTRTVDTHILELRKKLEDDPSHPQHLIGVRGKGYKFIP